MDLITVPGWMAGWDDDNPSGFGVESDVETAVALDRANSETGLALEDAEPRAPSPVDFDIPALRTHSCAYVCELSELLVEQAKTAAAKPAATTTAEGYAHWLAAFWFAAQQRKHGRVALQVVGRSGVRVEMPECDVEQGAFEARWKDRIASGLRKVEVEDLGDMDAPRLWAAIPESDSGGRGRRDLAAIEKDLSVKVVFCENRHVLLVGAKAKLQKKCLSLRNLLSHYHWRLSGRDVSFESMTAR